MKKIILSDRSQEPEVIKVVTPEPIPAPVVEEPGIDVIEFSKPGDTTEGMYNDTIAEGHLFTANGRQFLIEANDYNKTINEAMKLVPKGTLIRIEHLGFNEEEQRGNFEVSNNE